jgi:ABC-2 type transport system ATP-binding protein
MTVLVVKDVGKKYQISGQAREVLKDINFSVQAGDFVNLRGCNGAGKSTLINSILGLQQIDRGTIEIFGLPPDDSRSRLRVGCMLQRARVPKHLKVEELIDLVRSYYPNPLSTEEILTRANLKERRNNKASDLSGGEERSLYFALAIAGNPDLLILDEPTNDLSATAREKLWQQIKDFNREGKTIIIVTHQESDLQEINQSVRRVLELDAGKLEEIPQDRPVNPAPSLSTIPQKFQLLNFPLDKAFLSQIKVELLSLLRQPSFLLTAIVFCGLAGFFRTNANNQMVVFVGVATFNLLFVALERFGVQIATEQTQGWTKLLRVTSLPAQGKRIKITQPLSSKDCVILQ